MSYLDTLDQTKVEQFINKNGEAMCRRYDTDDPRFAMWLVMADRAMTNRVGIGLMSVEDYTWRDEYDAGTSPVQAVLNGLDYMGMWRD